MLHKLVILFCLLCNVAVSWAGAWGAGSFENDSALDWVNENITVSTSLNVMSSAFAVVQTTKYADVDDCSSAIAAAEIIVALNSNHFERLPENVAGWARRNKKHFNKTFVAGALNAVNVCTDTTRSELAQLWKGTLYEEWKKNIDHIKNEFNKK